MDWANEQANLQQLEHIQCLTGFKCSSKVLWYFKSWINKADQASVALAVYYTGVSISGDIGSGDMQHATLRFTGKIKASDRQEVCCYTVITDDQTNATLERDG